MLSTEKYIRFAFNLFPPLHQKAYRYDVARSAPRFLTCREVKTYGGRSQSVVVLLGQKGFKTIYKLMGGMGA